MSVKTLERAPAKYERMPYLVVFGLMLGMLLGMLDSLIVGTALPTIIGDLGGMNRLSWVVTAYTLTTAVATPLWGKIGDLYGRKSAFLASIVIFLAGSMLAGLAQTMNQLIGFRGLQGLGAGGLMVGAFALIGELVPSRDSGRMQALLGGMMPVAFVGGPLVGGFLTDHLSWRWAFYVNVPLGAVALLIVGLGARVPSRRIRARIDYAGATLLTIGIVSLALLASWAGTRYSWASAPVVLLAAVGLVALIGFGYVETRAAEPILPPRLFRNRNFTLAQILSFLTGAVMFAVTNVLPQYLQNVRGASPTASGLLLLPLMFGMLAVQLTVGQVITRTGRYRIFPIIGGVVLTGGMLALLALGVNTRTAVGSGLTLVAGLGIGFLMQTTTLITLNSAERRDMGAASGSVTLARTIGGSLGIAALGAVYSSRLDATLTDRLGAAGQRIAAGNAHLTPEALRHLAAPVRQAFRAGVAHGVHSVAVAGAVIAAACFLTALFLREVPLRDRESAPVEQPTDAVQS
jgi:EmrB/QacA subfamily drug resistance transporter